MDHRVSRFGLVLAAGLSLCLLGACTRPTPSTHARHVVLLGLDGGTWDLLDPYIERGLLPNLARLREQGAWAPLKSMSPSSSPVIWTTIATGKGPQEHGITFFVRFPTGDTGKPGPVTSTMRRCKAFWNILSDLGYDVAVVGWFVTWPVEAINGRMISDRAHWGATDERGVFPPAYLAAFEGSRVDDAIAALPEFMQVDFDPRALDVDSTDPEQRLNALVFDRFVKAYVRDLYYLRAAERVLEDGALPNVLALYLRGTDDVQHGFWKFMQPELFDDVTPEQAERFGTVIERYWQWIDTAVGKVLSHYEDVPRLVLVVSDHGAGPAVGKHKITTHRYSHLSGSHRDTGILIANGPGTRKGTLPAEPSVYDITPTLLYYLGEAVAADMEGRPLTELFSSVERGEVLRIDSYDAGKPVARHVESEFDEKALEHLRSLGYIE